MIYYNVTAVIDGEVEELFGSYDRADCTYELDAERDSWKGQGYRKFKIVSKEVQEDADPKVYTDAFTSKQFYMKHAPDFIFELDADELIERGLEEKFIAKIGDDLYIYTKEESA